MGQAQEGWQIFTKESMCKCLWTTDQCVQRLATLVSCWMVRSRLSTYRNCLPRLASLSPVLFLIKRLEELIFTPSRALGDSFSVQKQHRFVCVSPGKAFLWGHHVRLSVLFQVMPILHLIPVLPLPLSPRCWLLREAELTFQILSILFCDVWLSHLPEETTPRFLFIL